MTESNTPRDDDPLPDTDGTIRTDFDWDAVAPSTAVIETVAIAADADPTTLEPLYESIDPSALDALVRADVEHPTSNATTVSFAVAGHEVTLRSTGTVAVRPIEDDR